MSTTTTNPLDLVMPIIDGFSSAPPTALQTGQRFLPDTDAMSVVTKVRSALESNKFTVIDRSVKSTAISLTISGSNATHTITALGRRMDEGFVLTILCAESRPRESEAAAKRTNWFR